MLYFDAAGNLIREKCICLSLNQTSTLEMFFYKVKSINTELIPCNQLHVQKNVKRYRGCNFLTRRSLHYALCFVAHWDWFGMPNLRFRGRREHGTKKWSGWLMKGGLTQLKQSLWSIFLPWSSFHASHERGSTRYDNPYFFRHVFVKLDVCRRYSCFDAFG